MKTRQSARVRLLNNLLLGVIVAFLVAHVTRGLVVLGYMARALDGMFDLLGASWVG